MAIDLLRLMSSWRRSMDHRPYHSWERVFPLTGHELDEGFVSWPTNNGGSPGLHRSAVSSEEGERALTLLPVLGCPPAVPAYEFTLEREERFGVGGNPTSSLQRSRVSAAAFPV